MQKLAPGNEGRGTLEKKCCVLHRANLPTNNLAKIPSLQLAGELQNYSQALQHGMKGAEKVAGHTRITPPGAEDISSVTSLG